MSYCKLHNTCPKDDEPCWQCIIEFSDKELERKNERLRHAISPFVSFKHFIDCLCETQHEKPFTEHDCICSAMGSGGSDYIWYKDLMKAEQILEGD